MLRLMMVMAKACWVMVEAALCNDKKKRVKVPEAVAELQEACLHPYNRVVNRGNAAGTGRYCTLCGLRLVHQATPKPKAQTKAKAKAAASTSSSISPEMEAAAPQTFWVEMFNDSSEGELNNS